MNDTSTRRNFPREPKKIVYEGPKEINIYNIATFEECIRTPAPQGPYYLFDYFMVLNKVHCNNKIGFALYLLHKDNFFDNEYLTQFLIDLFIETVGIHINRWIRNLNEIRSNRLSLSSPIIYDPLQPSHYSRHLNMINKFFSENDFSTAHYLLAYQNEKKHITCLHSLLKEDQP